MNAITPLAQQIADEAGVPERAAVNVRMIERQLLAKDPGVIAAYQASVDAKRAALAERIAREKAVVDAEQAARKPVADDFWRFRTGPDGLEDRDSAFGPNSHTYWGR